ncbi:MAG: hypothetical protein NZ108_05115, partial [Bacteroidia bacterium]|nr:hypothetical protein [Bacteroidia bacterium]
MPRPNIGNITGPTNLCAGSTANYTVPTTAGFNYQWIVNGGVVLSGQGTGSVQVQWGAPGNHQISVIESNFCGTDTAFLSVITEGTPSPSTISGANPVCEFVVGQVYSVPIRPGFSYNWTVTGGTITAGQGTSSVTVSWGATGIGIISVTETSPCGVATASRQIIINNLPNPAAISGPDTICQGSSAAYSVPATTGSSYVWSATGATFPNGNTANFTIASWSSSGVIKVVETNSCGTDSSTLTVILGSLPNITAISGSNQVCSGINYTYSITNQSGSTYQWTTTNGTISGSNTLDSVVVSWNGNGTLQVIETNACGSDTATMNVTQSNTIVSNPIIGEDTVCLGVNYIYSVVPNPGSSILWSSNDVQFVTGNTLDSVTVRWNTAGTLTLIETNACGSDTSVFTTTLAPIPQIFPISGPDTVCQNTSGVNYSVPLTTGYTYSWTVAGGTITAGANTNQITVDWGNGSFGQIFLDTQTNCGLVKDTLTVILEVIPQINSISGDSVFCVNQVSTYFVDSIPGATYTWNITGGNPVFPSTTRTISVLWATPGSGKVVVTSTNACGTDTDSIQVTIKPLPIAAISSVDTLICQGTTGATYFAAPDSEAIFSWSVPSGGTITSASNLDSVTVNWGTISGFYPIILTATNSCGLSRDSILVQIRSQASIFITGEEKYCKGQSTTLTANPAGFNYTWSTGATSQSITLTADTSVSVSVVGIDNFGCQTAADTVFVTVLDTIRGSIWGNHTVCAGDSLQLVAVLDGNISSIFWFPGNFPGISVIYAPTDTMSVTAIITAANGCQSQIDTIIPVNQIPNVAINLPATVCAEDTAIVSYGLPAGNGYVYNWNFGNATVLSGSNEGPYELVWQDSGLKFIRLEVVANGCSSSIIRPIVVKPLPIADAGRD